MKRVAAGERAQDGAEPISNRVVRDRPWGGTHRNAGLYSQGPRRVLLSRQEPRSAGKCPAEDEKRVGGCEPMLPEPITCDTSGVGVRAARRSACCALVSSRSHALTNSCVASIRQRLLWVRSRGYPSLLIARAALSPAFAPRVVWVSETNAAGRTIWQGHASWCRSAPRLDQ